MSSIIPSHAVAPSPTSPSLSAVLGNPFHPISEAHRANDLGKLMLSLALTVALYLLDSAADKDNGRSTKGDPVVLVGLMAGAMFIWNGILFRTTFDHWANVVELIGTALVLVSLFMLVAFNSVQLSKAGSSMVCTCGVLCMLPLLLSLLGPFLKPQPTTDHFDVTNG